MNAKTKLQDLYHKDQISWAMQNAALLESGKISEIDALNIKVVLIEMGASERRAAFSQMVRLMKHLLKMIYQPEKRTRSWDLTVDNARLELVGLFLYKSILNFAKGDFEQAYLQAVKQAVRETKLPVKTFPKKPPFTFKQMLDDEYYGTDPE